MPERSTGEQLGLRGERGRLEECLAGGFDVTEPAVGVTAPHKDLGPPVSGQGRRGRSEGAVEPLDRFVMRVLLQGGLARRHRQFDGALGLEDR